jgi:hypothetical protein
MMANVTKAKPAAKKAQTEDYIKEINDLLRSGKPDIDIVRHIAANLDIPISADARLASVKFIVRTAVVMNNDQSKLSELGKHHLDKAMAVTKKAMDDFLQRNPYHAEYSFAAIYEEPAHGEEISRFASTWHYGAKASSTLWPWPKIETALKDWLKEQPVTKNDENKPHVTHRLVAGHCNVRIVDSRGNDILKNEFGAMNAVVKTNSKEVTGVTIR